MYNPIQTDLSLTLKQVTEAILNNQSCFLDDPAWIATLQCSATDNPLLPGRGPLAISLLVILTSIPRLFRDITKAICQYLEPPLTTMVELMARARKVRVSLQNWHSRYFGPDETPAHKHASCKTYSKRMILFYICSIYCNRLNTCIYQMGESDINEVEEESQRFANIIVSLHNEEASSNDEGSVLLAQKVPIAEATINTGGRWKKQLSLSNGQSQLYKMPKQTFKQWCSLFGRKTC
jgi:hypothetical protein